MQNLLTTEEALPSPRMLQRERERLADEIFTSQEELQTRKRRLEELLLEENQYQEHARARRRSFHNAQVVDTVINEVLEEITSNVLHSCSGEMLEPASNRRINISGVGNRTTSLESDKENSKLQQIVDQLSSEAQDLGLAAQGRQRDSSQKLLRVFVYRIDSSSPGFDLDNLEPATCCVVLASPEMVFEDLAWLVTQHWGLVNTDQESHVLVDQAGTVWPSQANVLVEVCQGAEPRLFLETIDRSRQALRMGFDNLPQDLPMTRVVAPLLGEHMQNRGLNALTYDSQSPNHGITSKRPSSLTLRNSIDPSHVYYFDEVLRTKSRCLWDFVLALILFSMLLAMITVEDVAVLNEAVEPINNVRDMSFASERGSTIYFGNISAWRDMYGFIEGPLSQVLASTAGPLARNNVVMPLRLRQNRVVQSRFKDPTSRCPDLAISLNQDLCYPEYNEDTRSTSFWKGATEEELAGFSEQFSQLSPEAREAFEYVTNPWTPLYRWQFPSASSPDLMPWYKFPSAGYVVTLPTMSNGTVNQTILQELKNSPVPWVDDQTRYLSLSVTYYNGNYGVFVIANFDVWLSEQGTYIASMNVHALNDFSQRENALLYTASILVFLVVIYMLYTLFQYFFVTARHANVRFAVLSERARAHQLTRGLAQTGISPRRAQRKYQRRKLVNGQRSNRTRVSKSERRPHAPLSKILLRFVLDFWNAIDILIVIFALLSIAYMNLSYRSGRFTSLPLPSEFFVDISVLSQHAEMGRLFAAHAVGLLAIKFFKYARVRPYLFLEYGIVYYSCVRVFNLTILLVLFVLAFSISSFLFFVSNSTQNADFLQSFLLWQSVFAGSWPGTQLDKEPALTVTLQAIFMILVHVLVIQSVVAICFQGRVQLSTERMQHETEAKSSVFGLSNQIFTRAGKWWERNKLGQPNF